MLKQSSSAANLNSLLGEWDNFLELTHPVIPDCVSPIISSTEQCPEHPGIHGTGFFAAIDDRILFITARHCLSRSPGDRDPSDADVATTLAQLQLPLSLEGKKASRSDFVIFERFISIHHKNPEIPGNHLDLVVLDECRGKSEAATSLLLSRAARIPTPGTDSVDFAKAVLQEVAALNSGNIPLVALGYPSQGTCTEISPISSIDLQPAAMRGVVSRGSYPHTIEMNQLTWPVDTNGFSGSPVFAEVFTPRWKRYLLVGVLVYGGIRRAQFVPMSLVSPVITRGSM